MLTLFSIDLDDLEKSKSDQTVLSNGEMQMKLDYCVILKKLAKLHHDRRTLPFHN